MKKAGVGNRHEVFPISKRLFICEQATNSRASQQDALTQVGGKYVVKVKTPHALNEYLPPVVDYDYLARVMPRGKLRLVGKETLNRFTAASKRARKRFIETGPPLLRRAGEMFPWREVSMPGREWVLPLRLHYNTKECTEKCMVYKLDPTRESEGCDMACAYCLTDRQNAPDKKGKPRNNTVWTVSETLIRKDYDKYVAKRLEEMRGQDKTKTGCSKPTVLDLGVYTDFFSEAMLQSGMAHKILIAIINHFKKHAGDPTQIIVYSKAGLSEMVVPGPNGEPPAITLLQTNELRRRTIFVGSIAPMSPRLREIFEPGAPVLEDRIALYYLLVQFGLLRTVLVQPLIPGVYDRKTVESYFRILRSIGVEQVKLQLVTLDEAVAAALGPIIGKFCGARNEKKFWNSIDWGIPDVEKKGGRRFPPKLEITARELVKYKKLAESQGLYVSFCGYDVTRAAGRARPWPHKPEISNLRVERKTGHTCVGYRISSLTCEELNKPFQYSVDIRFG